MREDESAARRLARRLSADSLTPPEFEVSMIDSANDGLTSGVDVDVLDGDALLALAAMSAQGGA